MINIKTKEFTRLSTVLIGFFIVFALYFFNLDTVAAACSPLGSSCTTNTTVCSDPQDPSTCYPYSCSGKCDSAGTCVCGSSCDQCSCESPSGMTWISPNQSNINFQNGLNLDWSEPNWGKKGSRCDGCSTPSATDKYYEVFVGGVNKTDQCSGASGSKITTSECTFSTIDPSWPGTSQNISIKAYNGCGQQTIDKTIQFPENAPPFCTGFTTTGGRRAPADNPSAPFPTDYFAARPEKEFSITVNAGETDVYGPPKSIQICFALKAQVAAGAAQWHCPTVANKANSGTLTSTFNQIKAVFSTNPFYNTVDTQGFVVTSNIHDNLSSKFCNGWNMYQPATPPPTSCNGGTCRLFLGDRNPEISSVQAPSGWIGTSPDSDNGLSCSDNNPAIYRMTVTDPDGSADIDQVELSLAKGTMVSDTNNDNIMDNPLLERNWPIKIQFAKKAAAKNGQEFADGTFWVRDMAVISNNATNNRCIDKNGQPKPYNPTGWDENNPNRSKSARKTGDSVFCYGLDDHSWDDVSILSNQSLDGISVDVYYLRNDIEVFSEGYHAKLKADSTNWQSSSYVAYEKNGKRVFTQFVVEYLDNEGADKWSGEYANVWYTRTLYGKNDVTENLANSYMIHDGNGHTYHVSGTTKIDLTPPEIQVSEPSPIAATRLRVPWTATDATSGLDAIYGEASATGSALISNITNVSTGVSYDPTQLPPLLPQPNPPLLAEPYLWNNQSPALNAATNGEVVDIGQNEEGTIKFEAFAQDNACNFDRFENQVNLSTPWVLTKGGHVYSSESPDIDIKTLDSSKYPATDPISPEFTTYPFNINKWESNLSSELLSSGRNVSPTQLPYAFEPTRFISAFSIQDYQDKNNHLSYVELKVSAERQIGLRPNEFTYIDRFKGNVGGNISAITASGKSCVDPSKMCVISVTGDVNVNDPNNPLICDRKTAFIISGGLTVNSDIKSSDAISGCIFIVSGNVSILGGSYKSTGSTYPKYDYIDSFIISDAKIHVQEADTDPSIEYRDGLMVNGALIAFGQSPAPKESSVVFERSLKLLDNLHYPAEVIRHDVKYVTMAKEIFGGDNETYKKEIGFKP